MNKKILIMSLCIILIIAIGSSIVFANLNRSEKQDSQTPNLEGTVDIDETYVKVDMQKARGMKDTDEETINTANTYLEKYNLTNEHLSDKATVEVYRNNLDSITETVISESGMRVKLNQETNELLSYSSSKCEFEKCTLSKTEIEKMAWKLLENFVNSSDYTLTSLEQFDEEIYLVKFDKKCGKYVNVGEHIGFSFAPQTSEILTFSKKDIPFANNEIVISEENAKENAKKYLEKSTANAISSISLEIVQPNSALKPALKDGRVYLKSTETRLAYVCTFSNQSQTQIFIDCTTGEVIGANGMLGGEF